VSKEIIGRKRLPLELKRMVLDNSKAKRLGWKPQIELKEGLRKEYAWLEEDAHRWERMSY
jgi:nucleoside-diphosphate-sugar epimerase